MCKHEKTPVLPAEVQDLAKRYPALHMRFGDEVLIDLVARMRERDLVELDGVAKYNAEIARDIVSATLCRKIECKNFKS